jgi:hypothetical protein
MTVQEIFFTPFKGNEYRCQWFVDAQYKGQIFNGKSLEGVPDDEKGQSQRDR